MSPFHYQYSVGLLKKFRLKEKRDLVFLQNLIESDLFFLVNTNDQSMRYDKVIKNIAENLYGYIQFKSTNYIYEKNILGIMDDYNNRIDIIVYVINEFITYTKNI